MTYRLRLTLLFAVPLLAVVGAVLLAQSAFAIDQSEGRVLRVVLPITRGELAMPRIGGVGGKPLVVIDAGHGGHDPGAAGEGVVEKDLVLGLALALRDELLSEGDVRVALTREDDRYLVHAERFELARRLDADLFISIHADSAGEASEVTGASVYTLSEEASSRAAARFASRENASDRLNGVDIGGQSNAVSSILFELSQRRKQERSSALARTILRAGEGRIKFHPQPQRAAALLVLRAPDVPSILFESGYITNADDVRRLASSQGRQRFADVMARAIREWFQEG